MVLYQCPRCGHNFNKKIHYTEHINKKNKCEAVLEDIEPNITNFIRNPHRFTCNICNKTYSTQDNLTKHKCKPNGSIIINNIHNDNSINNSNNSTVNNYIIVNDFNNTNFEHITDDKKYEFLKSYSMAIPRALKEANFNVKYPHNHNIYLSNSKLKTIKYKEGDKWCSKKGKEIIEDIITKYDYKLFYQFSQREDIKQKYPNIEEIYDKYIEITDKGDGKEILMDRIYEVLYNNKELVMKTNNL
jgi:transposase-like protein